jgi:hypothetical protein
MVSFDICFDNTDALLGLYFEQSKVDIVNFIIVNCLNHTINEIPSHRCNQAYIDIRIAQININNFLFIAYAHGKDDSLVANGSYFIKKNVNSSLFVNSLFYSMSCLTAKELGADLVVNGSHAFIGYNNDADALLGNHQQLSIDCDNSGIKNFILGSSIKEAFNQMKDFFTQKIDWLEENGEPLLAALLTANRDSLSFEGNSNLTFENFNIN